MDNIERIIKNTTEENQLKTPDSKVEKTEKEKWDFFTRSKVDIIKPKFNHIIFLSKNLLN